MTTVTRQTVMPEMLGRDDRAISHGSNPWEIHECAPLRGMPMTDIRGRKMHVPGGDNELERCIRAHEMMHAKVSPSDDWLAWVRRGVASEAALRAVEEVRVNRLCQLAGFDMKKHLADGGETADGERVALSGDWAAAVYAAVAYMETASLRLFLKGVRRHNKAWAAELRGITTRISAMVVRIRASKLGATTTDVRSGLTPEGFVYTEQIAEFVDRIAHPPAAEEDAEPDAEADPKGKRKREVRDEEDGGDGDNVDGGAGDAPPPPIRAKDVKEMKMMPRDGQKEGGTWLPLKPKRCRLSRPAPGGLGKRRRPSAFGRNPRHIGRLLTDPHQRIFEQRVRGNGGVVLIDGSGSMRLSYGDVIKIVEAAPGATVAIYSANSAEQEANLWILAENGKMIDAMPDDHRHGNGVDLPAIEWAVEQRQHSASPVVWITDGLVHGVQTRVCLPWEAFQCARVAVENKVIVRPNVKNALLVLEDLKKGRKAQAWWPREWINAYKDFANKRLVSKAKIVTHQR